MDKIIKITAGIFTVILVLFVAAISYGMYIDTQYKNSLAGTYTYNCTIATNSVLSNITLFLPVPADQNGNSPVVWEISSRNVTGVPHDWTLSLYDTGKETFLKVSAPHIGQPAINGSSGATSVTFAVNISSHAIIDTRAPVENAAVFRPVRDIRGTTCPASNATNGSTPECYQYLTSTYADYTASPMASVTISASLDATNSWTIFQQPASNSYHNTIYVYMQGENHGWVTTRGELESGIGTYQVPGLTL